MEDFLEYCSYKNLSNKTIKSYNQTLVLFMRYLEEEKDIIDINKEIVQEYIIFTRNRGKYSFVASTDSMIKANIDKRNDIGEQVSDATLNNYLRNILFLGF
ncbi:site-specific integrase [Clostridium sporogenes]|uniref:site-specific integrase n=1 Tax=Clostridium sporogenes TaxID=1509 RepID=UPI002236F80D|nr:MULTISPECIES: phage integrase N-terminal SAM-like domain-containing protein [Clostridium]MDU4546259.1 phage integrase N-terminal SAM-like domain-containing protein [Clostridium botulinum]MDU5118484.1 phage integrase N-terminal SAM-like domain-containing protein [Clostridium botulinum]